MAFLENRNGKFRIKFRFEGHQYSRSIKSSNEQQARLAKANIERNLELVALGLLSVPDGCDVFDFFLTGKEKERAAPELKAKQYQKRTNGPVHRSTV